VQYCCNGAYASLDACKPSSYSQFFKSAWNKHFPILIAKTCMMQLVVNPVQNQTTPMKENKDVWSKGSDNQWIKSFKQQQQSNSSKA